MTHFATIRQIVRAIFHRRLVWTGDAISTFAAHAPLDEWVSISMLLLAFAILLMGLEVSLRPKERSDVVAGLLPYLASLFLLWAGFASYAFLAPRRSRPHGTSRG